MSYLLTSATDADDLLAEIRDFAVLDGWVTDYDTAGRLGLSKGVCKVSFQNYATTVTDANTSAVLDENFLRMSLAETFAGGVTTYHSHTGSLATADADADAIITNDLEGPFSNVWLFSNAAETFINVVIQCSPYRFAFISFGILDDHALDQPDVAYVAGHNYVWWADQAGVSPDGNRAYNWPASTEHKIGFFCDGNQQVRIPDTLLDPALGFTDGTFITRTSLQSSHNRGDEPTDAYANANGLWLDFFQTTSNDLTTGGVPLSLLPVFYIESEGHVFLGDYPDVRLVNMTNLEEGQELTYGSETWVVFPMKQKGLFADSNFGGSPQLVTNSINYGLAFKKTV